MSLGGNSVGAFIVAIVAALVMLVSGSRVGPIMIYYLKTLEQKSLDIRFAIRGYQPVTVPIVIVEIDRVSLEKLGAWPWPRSVYSRLISVLNSHGAKVIGVDIIFDSPGRFGAHQDAVLSNTLQRHSNVVLASKRSVSSEGGFEMARWDIPITLFRDYADYGFVNQTIDTDNRVRNTWVVWGSEKNDRHYSWDLITIAKYYGITTDKILMPDPNVVQMGARQVRLESGGQIRINFLGPENHFLNIPVYQVLNGQYPDMTVFKNKIVLIGATDPALNDFFLTPFGQLSGVELHANALATILTNTPLRTAPLWANTLMLIGVVGVTCMAGILFEGLIRITLLAGVFTLTSAIVVGLFGIWGWVVLWVTPLVLMGLTTGFIYLGKYQYWGKIN